MVQIIKANKGVQSRTVRKVVQGKKVRVTEPLKKGYALALINGGLNVVKL